MGAGRPCRKLLLYVLKKGGGDFPDNPVIKIHLPMQGMWI